MASVIAKTRSIVPRILNYEGDNRGEQIAELLRDKQTALIVLDTWRRGLETSSPDDASNAEGEWAEELVCFILGKASGSSVHAKHTAG